MFKFKAKMVLQLRNNFVVTLLVLIEVVLPQIVFWAILIFAQNECML